MGRYLQILGNEILLYNRKPKFKEWAEWVAWKLWIYQESKLRKVQTSGPEHIHHSNFQN